MPKKDVLIRGVDDLIYRQAKAVAATKGITLAGAIDEALTQWAKEAENTQLDAEIDANLKFVRSSWNKIRANKGKIVVVAGAQLQGVFPTYAEARAFASKKKIAMVFVVDKPPMEREIEFGPELEL
jgi:hypothetical protein